MLNIPNLLALARILLAFVLLFLLTNQDSKLFAGVDTTWLNYFAALTFTLGSITDFFDGFVARSLNQITTLGKIIDPLADKMLTLAGFLGLMALGRADLLAIYLIIVRELFITGLRVDAAAKNLEVSASMSGKIKTVVQMFAIGFLLMDWSGGNELLWLAVALTLYSGAEYVRAFMQK